MAVQIGSNGGSETKIYDFWAENEKMQEWNEKDRRLAFQEPQCMTRLRPSDSFITDTKFETMFEGEGYHITKR
jgi:hypothetical protein